VDTPTYLPSNAAVGAFATSGIADVVDAGARAEGDAVGSGTAHPAAPDKIDKIRRLAPERIAITLPARKSACRISLLQTVENWYHDGRSHLEGSKMAKGIGWLWVLGFFGLAVEAIAQTPSSQTAGAQFDGTYAFVSSTKLAEMYTLTNGRMAQCPDWTAGPLTIVGSQARFSTTSALNLEFEGTIGRQGELAMQSVQAGRTGPAERTLRGRIDRTGMVHARLTGRWCNYDYVWRK
jgi:hypothetical protein